MPHYDEDTLALLALGESGATPDHEGHLASCSQCRSEVDTLSAVVDLARKAGPDDELVEPPS